MSPITEILKRVEAEIAVGRAWRAKETLRGALATRAEPELLERYGRLLDSLGERYEAGKYLFLSGSRTPDCREAIQVFLTRNAARRDADFVKLFPVAVRRLPFQQLPPPVQEDLKARGVRQDRFSRERPIVPTTRYGWRDWFNMTVGTLITAILVLALGLGIAQILNWVSSVVTE
jgi:hypothetical protein